MPQALNIWVVNPFDLLPNESDVPLRYWALCRTLAQQGHKVIWWSSDFSHLNKQKRNNCPDTDGFSLRLIPTPPYTKNVSLARLKNHKAFARGFHQRAIEGLQSGDLQAPDRIVVSIPPLGVAEQAFKIRDHVGKPGNRKLEPEKSACQVIVDIMDAWPETFYQVIPKPLRNVLGPILLSPMHRSARRAYQGADKISAVGQSYLDLAQQYLGQQWRVESGKWEAYTPDQVENVGARLDAPVTEQHGTTKKDQTTSAKPMHLCYHGTDLERFAKKTDDRQQSTEQGSAAASRSAFTTQSSSAISHLAEGENQSSPNKPLKAVYLGSMGQGYDLMTILKVATRWKAEGTFPVQIHFAGTGDQLEQLKAYATQEGLLTEDRRQRSEVGGKVAQLRPAAHQSDMDKPKQMPVPSKATRPDVSRTGPDKSQRSESSDPPSVISHQSSLTKSAPSAINHQSSVIDDSSRIAFHGYLQRDAITELLLSADIALVPNRPDSLVACPYKAGEYAAAGLPMISCLDGELNELLTKWNAGCEYNEGDVDSLYNAFEKYSLNRELLHQHAYSAWKLAEQRFNRAKTYISLSQFITS